MNVPTARVLHCAKCGADIHVPDLSAEARAHIAALVRAEQKAEATRQLNIKWGVALVEAKGVVLHITTTKGQCNRCRRAIEVTEEAVCRNCIALNLNW